MTWGPRRAVFCGVRSARVFFVAKANNEGADAGRECGSQNAGTAEKRIPHRILIFSWGACGDLGGCGIMRGE